MRLIRKDSFLYFLLLPLKKRILLARHQSEYRSRNSHNKTIAKNTFPIDKVKVGKATYGEIEFYSFGNQTAELNIGSYCSIAGNVLFLGGGNHPINHLSTFPFSRHIFGHCEEEDTNGPIIVEDDVWICESCIILSGVRICQGAIIAANSIVTKDVPPYAIWMGNKVVKYRFEDCIREKLQTLVFGNIDMNSLSEICDDVITNDNINDILERLISK